MNRCRQIDITHEPAIYRKLKVFLCHSSVDKIEIRKIYKKLCGEDIDPWFDEEKLLAGQDWQYEISKAVRESDAVILCLSSNSINRAGYVHKEIKYALEIAEQQPENTIYLIPIKLDQCKFPLHLSRWHFINYFEDKGYDKLIHALKKRANELGLCTIKFPILSCSPWSKVSGSEQASKFTPRSYPAKIMRLRFYITSSSKPCTPFEVRIYDDSVSEQPGKPMINEKIIGAAKRGDEWVGFDISKYNIVIKKGDFYVSMYWITAPGQEGQNAQFLGARMYGRHLPNRTYIKFEEHGKWSLDDGKQWMIQAIMGNGDILDNTLVGTSPLKRYYDEDGGYAAAY